ncbi:hypothetical protein [Bartonella sp. LJL80]
MRKRILTLIAGAQNALGMASVGKSRETTTVNKTINNSRQALSAWLEQIFI